MADHIGAGRAGRRAAPSSSVWLVALDRLACAADVFAVLDDEERRRAGSLRVEQARRRHAAARAALRVVLGTALDLPPRAVPLELGAFGKPRLAIPGGPGFNVSRCGGTAAIVLATAGEVGVDIDSPARIREPAALAARFFERREAATIASLPPAPAAELFIRCWTAKEAVLKALGVGLAHPLHEVAVDMRSGAPLRLRLAPAPYRPSDWTLHGAILPGRLVLATALPAAGAQPPALSQLDVRQAAAALRGRDRRRPT